MLRSEVANATLDVLGRDPDHVLNVNGGVPAVYGFCFHLYTCLLFHLWMELPFKHAIGGCA